MRARNLSRVFTNAHVHSEFLIHARKEMRAGVMMHARKESLARYQESRTSEGPKSSAIALG